MPHACAAGKSRLARRSALLCGLTLVGCLGSPSGPTAFAQCQIVGSETVICGGTTFRAVDDECVHYVDLSTHNAAHPGVPLPDLRKTVIDNYDPQAVPAPVALELVDYVDCTLTDHNFTDAALFPDYASNHPSRLMNISGRMFRVTGAPDSGFATYYYSYDMATGGMAGEPHLLVAELSNDQERYTSLQVHYPDSIVLSPGEPWNPPYAGEPTYNPWGDPWWSQNFARAEQSPVFGPDVGVTFYTGRELPIDNRPFNTTMIVHPKTATARVVISSTGCNVSRSITDGGAVSRIWLFRFVDAMTDRLPQPVLPDDPAHERRIGIYMTHPWYFYAHYGTPVRLLGHRQEGLQRMVRHFKYCGMNYIVFNAINGADRSEKAWYDGSAHYNWNSAGDLLSELPPICQAEGVDLVPIITALKRPTYSGGLTFTNASYQLGTDGDYTRAFGNPTLDPLRPEVQQLTFNLLTEIATRCAGNPAVRGIGIRANGKIGTCYTSDDDGSRGARLSGYSSWDLQQFKNATGSGVPTSPPQTAYNWLRANPAEWERWLNWRCAQTRTFWLACRDLIRSYRGDLVFYVQCDLPSETPGTNIEWAAGETPRDLLRHHGYDPDLFAGDTGIVISRGMMVAEDRFYVGTRWGPPWGSNYANYRLFHFAPELAEMYRSGQGRACEFYQNYWEEVHNPYYEFGSPGDPNGFFRTNTPTAPGRPFYEGAAMSVRRQDPDTMTWLGWNRPSLGHESDLRKFATAFRSLPAVDPTPFDGTIEPATPEVVARWHGDRLAVINDSSAARTIILSFAQPVPFGDEITDVVTGRKLVTALQIERQHLSFAAEAHSLNVFLYTEAAAPAADFTTGPLPGDPPLTVQFYDASSATNIIDWHWDFGDRSPAGSGPQPTHTYAGFDTYQVTLTITADEGILSRTRPVTLEPSAPTVAVETPTRGSSVGQLSIVKVTFSEAVTGVQSADLTVNGSSATHVIGSGAGPYLFNGFAPPGAGTATVSLAAGQIADLGGMAFAGDEWTCHVLGAPVPGLDNPSFEDNGGSLAGWQVVYITGEGPDNPPLSNNNPWNVITPFGTHFGGKITNGLRMDFYLGQVVGVSQWEALSTRADWQLNSYAQLQCTHENNPNPAGLHLTWEIGWNDDGSEPLDVMSCDHYEMFAHIDGTTTGNDGSFHPLAASGSITGVVGLRAVAIRAHLYNTSYWWWSLGNIDNVSFTATARPASLVPPDLDFDGDVDGEDVALFAACAAGPAVPLAPGCSVADFDLDADADQVDFSILQRCYSGAAPAAEGCATD